MEYAALGASDVGVSRPIFGAWVTGGWLNELGEPIR
jgi:aryl-alcohol dehydrogenase-like predicted oxidoreductase